MIKGQLNILYSPYRTERTGEHTIYTKAGDLLKNDMTVKDFRFMPSDAIIIVGRSTNNG